MYGFKQLFHFVMVLFAGLRFNAAANINAVCLVFQRFLNVIGTNTAGQEDAVRKIFDQRPVKALSRAAVKSFMVAGFALR